MDCHDDRRRLLCLMLLGILPIFLIFSPRVQAEAQSGLAYEHRTTQEPLSIHILEVDPSRVEIVAVRANDTGLGRELVSSMAARHEAIAAVNGGFFTVGGKYDGLPAGVLKIRDQWYSSSRNKRAAIGWTEDLTRVLIDRLHLTWTVEFNGAGQPVDGLNQPRSRNNCVVYTPAFSESTLTGGGGVELQVQDQKIKRKTEAGNASIPSAGFVYSIGSGLGEEAQVPEVGERARLSFVTFSGSEDFGEDSRWAEMTYIVGGTPLLLHQGEVVADFDVEKVREGFLKNKHPRTAIGVRHDGRWVLVVVDGRRPVHSLGMTMKELALLMQSLGCERALNLDGGGSSTFYLYGSVLNLPSDLMGERPVSDAILILPRD